MVAKLYLQNMEEQKTTPFNKKRFLIAAAATPIFFGLFLFWPAGTLAWERGWTFLLIFVIIQCLLGWYIWKVNPALMPARCRIGEGTKQWDKVILFILIPLLVSIFPIAALDDGRFHWSMVNSWQCAIGYLLLLNGVVFSGWAGSVNKFAEVSVRIQTERGHRVIDSGPYALMRHPGYVGAIVMVYGISLALGSWWGFVPATLCTLILVIRTYLEDGTLKKELQEYESYTKRIKYRLIPYLW